MSKYEVRFRLKKPLLVYALAICFIFAPLVNILVSMIGFGIQRWYSVAALEAFVNRISWVDWSWLSLTLIAGLCLLKQRKWSWLLAIASLAVAAAFNFHYGMKYSSHLAHSGHFFTALFMLSNLSFIVILYYFRYPYIDRREAWWGVKARYRCKLSASAEGGNGKISGTVTNISLTGAFLEAASSSPNLKEGSFVTLQLASLPAIKAEVVRAMNSGFGLHFDVTTEQKKDIKRFIGGLSELPIGDPALSIKI